MFGRVATAVAWGYNRVMDDNWRIAHHGASLTTKKRTEIWEHFMSNLVASVKVGTMTLKQKREVVHFIHPENMECAYAEGNGVVLVTGHLSCWELLAQIPEMLPSLKFNTIYQPLKNKRMDEWMRRERSRCGVGLINRRGAWKDACQKLRDGESVVVILDQHAGDQGLWVPLFDKLASTTPLPALLAKRTGAPIVPVAVRTRPHGGWDVEFYPPIRIGEAFVEETTWKLNLWLQKAISQRPADWLWGHRRWKVPDPCCLLKRMARGIYIPESVELQPFRVMVRGMNWLGDAVMHLTALLNLKLSRPDIHLTVLTPPKLADLYTQCKFIDSVIKTVPGKSVWKTAEIIKKHRFEAAILMPNSWRVVLEAWLGGISRRCGFRVRGRGQWVIDHPVTLTLRARGDEHQSLTWLRGMHWLGADFDTNPVRLQIVPGSGEKIRKYPFGVIAPGAEYGSSKRWFPDRFAETARKLAPEGIKQWVVVGSPGDAFACREVADRLTAAENLCAQTSLSDLMMLLSQTAIVLCNDSGVMHLAGLCGAKTVAIFGSTDPVATRSRNSGVAVVRHHLPCSPCFRRNCPFGANAKCLDSVHTEDVVAAASALLRNGNAGPFDGLAFVRDIPKT